MPRQSFDLAAGMRLDEIEIRNAQLRLSSLRNFEAVDVRLRRGAQRNAAVVVIEVTESSPITTESVAGLSSRLDATRSVFAARWAHQNTRADQTWHPPGSRRSRRNPSVSTACRM
jgi:hypothetical protein